MIIYKCFFDDFQWMLLQDLKKISLFEKYFAFNKLLQKQQLSESLFNFFLMLVLLRRTSFLDTFYVLYFNHHYTLHLQVYACSWKLFRFSSLLSCGPESSYRPCLTSCPIVHHAQWAKHPEVLVLWWLSMEDVGLQVRHLVRVSI